MCTRRILIGSPFLRTIRMMRTVLRTSISLLYLGVTVGMTVATHFCGGEPVSSNILDGTGEYTSCCCGDQEPMEGCCSTSITTLRVGDAHTSTSESFSVSFEFELIPAAQDPLFPIPPLIIPAELLHPPGPGAPTHILHCSLLI